VPYPMKFTSSERTDAKMKKDEEKKKKKIGVD
jgi:hypothetical protein